MLAIEILQQEVKSMQSEIDRLNKDRFKIYKENVDYKIENNKLKRKIKEEEYKASVKEYFKY